jgi:hypothetical protein
MVTNFELFFLAPYHKNFYGHVFEGFGQSVFQFSKMDKKNVQNPKPKTLFPGYFPSVTCVGTFFDTF